MTIDSDHIIKKLIKGKLTPEERETLNNSDLVNKALYAQWEKVENNDIDSSREERILAAIMRRINKKHNNRFAHRLFIYSGAAMIALCLILSTLIFTRHTDKQIVYVVNTGYQSMDSVKLADGTIIILNAGSRLTYPAEFSGKTREVMLSGQAFFKVHPDKKLPFIVKTKKMNLTVLGTSFEVFSYDNDKSAEAILLTGSVQIDIPTQKGESQKTYILHSDEKLLCQEDGKIHLTKVDAASYSSWRNGKRMSFKNETLEMILPRLEKWYGQKIECDPQTASHYRFTFTLHNEPLDLILNFISHSANLNYRQFSNDHYIIEK